MLISTSQIGNIGRGNGCDHERRRSAGQILHRRFIGWSKGVTSRFGRA
jgi:hypothetical protein